MKIIANNHEPKDIMRIIREWSDMTQEEFALTVNKSRRGIQSYENGTRKYRMDTLIEIAKEHNLTITISKDDPQNDL